MNNTQLYLSIGLPLFTLLLVFIANNRAIDALRSEMKTNMDALRNEMKTNMDALRSEMKTNMDALRSEMKISNDALHNDMSALRAEMQAGFQMLSKRIDDTNERIGRLEHRLDTIDTEIRINHDSRLALLEARILERAS